MVLVSLWRLVAERLCLLVQQLEGIVLCDFVALSSLDVVPGPLPQLASGDFGGGRVFHEVVDGDAADAADPGFHVGKADVEVLADAGFGDLSGDVHVEEVVGGDVDVFAADVHLVGRGHVLVEDFGCNRGEGRVSYPCAVVAGAHLTELVGADLGHGSVVGLLVVLDGDLGCHAAHGMDATPVACLDEKLDVGVHEGRSHGDRVAVGKDKVGVLAETLNGAENVVPAAAVETRRVVAKLVDDLWMLVSIYTHN